MMDIPIVVYGFNLVLLCFGTIISIIFLIYCCINIRPLKSNVLLILISNTYLALILSSITLFEASLTSLLSNLYPTTLPGISWCQTRSYLLYVGQCSVMYSFVLQAFFRLFQIVFFKNKVLRSLRVVSIAIILQWLLNFLMNLSYIFLNDIQYISNEYRCGIPFTNLRGTTMTIILTYVIPGNTIFLIYFQIIRYVRRRTNAIQHQQNTNRREIFVVKRIVIMFIVLVLLSVPLRIIWLLYHITGYTAPLNYYIQVLSSSVSQIIVSIVLASTTPQIWKKFKWRRRQVHPTVAIRVRYRNTQEFNIENLNQRF